MSSLIEKISAETRISIPDVKLTVRTASRRYKVYSIPKRDGTARIIAHPARELKAIQRALISESPASLRVHSAASAYEDGSSIAKNANIHVKNSWLAKFDLENFFNSITVSAWQMYLSKLEVDDEYVELSSKVFFWKPERRKSDLCLSVGAPSSPFASNRYMFSFDQYVSDYCTKNNLAYSRYADDIAISSQSEIELIHLQEVIEEGLKESRLKLNSRKTLLLGPGQRRVVTGVILKNDKKISLGRGRKRIIESMVHNYAKGKPSSSLEVIRGHLALLKMIDPDGYNRIRKRYENCTSLFK
ncbi:retron St85 family RNA-directed DNA polymerase [Hyphomonas pacifica]|uniref:retron St85 family RNA-directed DNA polymerase n=1 Tax=Hyphomonas pacifica TaxID=1280941 RepID=UPI000DBFDE04|nr:retron St85 family RNA-directed DNA polymerase [Hyphomonas pacifica]RAN37014.1 hypothetical protein HY11_10425 [Hyphomonas pacifica]